MEAAHPRFRRHPESNPPEKDIRGPGQLVAQAWFCPAVSPTRLQGAGSRRNPTPANQVSRGEAVDLEKNGGVLESVGWFRTPRVYEPTRPFCKFGKKTRSVYLQHQWARWRKTEPIPQQRIPSSFWRCVWSAPADEVVLHQCPPHWYLSCHSHDVAAAAVWTAPDRVCPTPHQALQTKNKSWNHRITESYGTVPED